MKRVLVTGAAGFIGSHLTERLAEGGRDVTALVRYTSKSGTAGASNLPIVSTENVKIVHGDICDSGLMDSLVSEHDEVIHLAALIGIPYSYKAPRSYLRINVEGTLNILEACRRSGAKLLVTSTSEVYGSAQELPMSTDHKLNAQSPYAASKSAADQFALSYHQSFGTDVSIVRPFNTFGPRQSARAVLPSIVSQALAFQKVNVGALDTSRDFNFVSNTVDGFLAVLNSARVAGRIIAFGSGETRSIREAISVVQDTVGYDFDVVTESERVRPEASEVDLLLCDNAEAEELVGYRPRVSFEDGVRRLVDFWQREPNLREMAQTAATSLVV